MKKLVPPGTTPRAGQAAKPPRVACRLHVELRHVRPKVWRRLLVPDTVSLAKLHRVLQAAMGWTNSHLHQFEVGRARYGQPMPDWDLMDDEPIVDERRVTLADALSSAQSMRYVYDFGDGWEHRIRLETAEPLQAGVRLPACLAGANACPPEDVGGPPGFEYFLDAIADPKHPEHADLLAWGGGEYDPRRFDLTAINAALRRIRL